MNGLETLGVYFTKDGTSSCRYLCSNNHHHKFKIWTQPQCPPSPGCFKRFETREMALRLVPSRWSWTSRCAIWSSIVLLRSSSNVSLFFLAAGLSCTLLMLTWHFSLDDNFRLRESSQKFLLWFRVDARLLVSTIQSPAVVRRKKSFFQNLYRANWRKVVIAGRTVHLLCPFLSILLFLAAVFNTIRFFLSYVPLSQVGLPFGK